MTVKQVSKNRLLYIDHRMRVEYHRGSIYFMDQKCNRMILAQQMETSFFMRFCAAVPVLERMFRCEPRFVTRWSDTEYLVSHRGFLYQINPVIQKVRIVCRYTAGTKNPLHFCEYCRNGKKEIVFGDYGGHEKDGSISIYRYTKEGIRKLAFFKCGQIDHIHRVEYDFYKDCYWIFTGDTDAASGIWKMDYNGENLSPYVIGKQCYRACTAFVERDRIVYATDTPLEKNHIYSIRLSDQSVKKLYTMPGPCIYGIRIKKEGEWLYVFSTSVEPDSRLPVYRYRLTYKTGQGVSDRFSYIVSGNEKLGFHPIWRSQKDILPIWLFQFGNHRFPNQKKRGTIYFCPQSCKKKGTWSWS